jgi:hypothetical protein
MTGSRFTLDKPMTGVVVTWESVALIQTVTYLLLLILACLTTGWLARSALRERRQNRAAEWARRQMSSPNEYACWQTVVTHSPIDSPRTEQVRISSVADTEPQVRRVRPYLPPRTSSGVSAVGRHARRDEVTDAETQEFSIDAKTRTPA